MLDIIKIINKGIAEFSGWLLSILMFLLVLNLITRSIGFPIYGLVEIGTFVFLSIVYLGLAHCEELEEHIRMDAIVIRLSNKLQRILDLSVYIFALVIVCVLVYALGLEAVNSFQTQDSVPAGTLALPTWPVKVIMFIGCLLYLFQLLLIFTHKLKRK